jgi:hypothetical protein
MMDRLRFNSIIQCSINSLLIPLMKVVTMSILLNKSWKERNKNKRIRECHKSHLLMMKTASWINKRINLWYLVLTTNSIRDMGMIVKYRGNYLWGDLVI